MSRGSGWEKGQWDESAHWQEKPEPEEPRGSRDGSKSKRKKDWQEDCRHWSKCQSYREQIRAPLLAQVKRMQKEMDNLVDRATDAEKKSLQAYTMLSSLSSGVEARTRKLKDQMASLRQKNKELEEAAAAAQQKMKQSQDLAGQQAVGLAAAAKQDKASHSEFALIAILTGPVDQVSDDRIAELQRDKKLLQEEKAKLEAALQTATQESTKQRAEDIRNAAFLRTGLKEMTEKHEEELKLKARQIRVDFLRVCPENASARCQDEARMSCRILRESLDKSTESEKKHKALLLALEKDIQVKLGKEATIKQLQSELAETKKAEADAEATTKHLRSELLPATTRSAELLMEEETMSKKLLEQGEEYMKMESQDALRSEMKMLQEEMFAMKISQRTAAPKAASDFDEVTFLSIRDGLLPEATVGTLLVEDLGGPNFLNLSQRMALEMGFSLGCLFKNDLRTVHSPPLQIEAIVGEEQGLPGMLHPMSDRCLYIRNFQSWHEKLPWLSSPSKEQFLKFVQHLKKVKSLSCYLEGVGARKKQTSMLRCAGLACYEIDAAIMRNAQSLVIHQDVSELTLVVRFSLCTSDLCVVKGLFGLTDLKNGSHACLLAATERVVRLFCCDDDDLVQHVRTITELIDMDAASDEQLAGRLMRASGAFFPGAKQVLRDPTHATRRLLSRPFAAIPQIATIHSTLVTGLNAMPHTIQCSGVLGNVFSKHCSELDSHAVTGKRIKSLQMRHHRFDSAQKPACRMILYIKPVILTAIYAAVHRRGDRDAERAEAFLDFLDMRSLVLLAMMSDAADEVITLLRVLDSENFEMAEISLEIDSMLSRLKYLFLQEDCGEQAFVKKRREQTHSAATLENREKIRQQALEDVEESMLVDQRVQAELHFQAAKQHKNKIQAYLDDAVLEALIPRCCQ
ncbi:unnamed protein product [Symbiodinium microadriaticum]|nr:unnamed protein product [Symbiodinium microadriaticum]